jgi:endonuclease/exonuclease/phosphatase family metal-dependent hydrolase
MQKIQNKFKLSLRISICFSIALISFLGCQSGPKKDSTVSSDNQPISSELVAKNSDEISVMSYNVENLFDASHDKDREDFTYLPLSQKKTPEVEKFCMEMKNKTYRNECLTLDWNEDVIKTKLKNIARVIRFVDKGQGPDNLLLAEVENESILKRLVKDELSELGYKTIVLLEGPDLRGIDPGFISKFPLVGKPQIHLIPYTDSDPEQLKWAKRSRGILEVTVKTPAHKNLTFLVAHFPSQSNPTAWRAQAIQYAKKLMTEMMKAGRGVVFGGDLNIIDEEEAKQGYFKNEMSLVGQVSHLVGCKTCLGTHNYRGNWSHLDVLVYSNNLEDSGLKLLPDSIQVVKMTENMKRNGTPMRFDHEKKEGASDHFPLYSRLKIINTN